MVPAEAPARGRFEQVLGRKDFKGAWDAGSERYRAAYTDLYPAFLAGRGNLNCYDRLHLAVRATPARGRDGHPNPAYRGEAWLEGGGTAEVAGVGGRRLEVAVEPAAAGRLVVNQNFAPGWRAQDGRAVASADGLLAVDVRPGDRRVVLEYTPPGLLLGLLTSLATVVVLAGAAWWSRRRARILAA